MYLTYSTTEIIIYLHKIKMKVNSTLILIHGMFYILNSMTDYISDPYISMLICNLIIILHDHFVLLIRNHTQTLAGARESCFSGQSLHCLSFYSIPVIKVK